jgi:shikimate dehydrogenase
VERWPRGGTSLAVLGHPIGHSLSPQMHAAALAALARTDAKYSDWRYVAVDVAPDALADALSLLHEKGFLGVNLTVPHKVLAVPMVGEMDPAARDAGAVNTLRRSGPGWGGFNTDGYGLASGIRQDLGLELRGAPVVILGAGGAARGAAAECLRAGCSALWILNRTRSNLDALLSQVGPLAGAIPLRALDPGTAAGLPEGTILINATSSGLRAGQPAPIDLALAPGVGAVYDMIYNPPETPLLAQARSRGLPHANGLGMLVHQGAKALEIWTGVPAEVTAPSMRAAAAKALGYR